MKSKLAVIVSLVLAATCVGITVSATRASHQEMRKKARKLYDDGNRKEALALYKELALDSQNDPKQVGDDLRMAVTCLQNLNRTSETDEFREAVIDAHADTWHPLYTAALSYFSGQHYGYIVAGEFERGQHRGGGRHVNSFERDRVRALQLMAQALELTGAETNKNELSHFYLQFARMLMGYRGYHDAWRLQYLTDLEKLPDYDEGYQGRYGSSSSGAPVSEDGTPVYHKMPASYEEAATDGERWRWMLMQAVEMLPRKKNSVMLQFADFHKQQFGVQRIAYYGRYWPRGRGDDDKKDESGTYALHTLSESETIARLATGIKRFAVPEEFNFIKVYQHIADDPETGYGEQALGKLAEIFTNRRQYEKAAEYWKRSIREYGDRHNKKSQLDDILGNWGQFDPITTHPAGKGATVEFRFRNGTRVDFEAHEIHVRTLLDDVKAYLKSNPRKLDHNKMNIANIGHRLVQEKEGKYVGKKVAFWHLDLEPRPMHFDSRITVTTPLQKPGAYLLTARMADGNTSKIIMWVNDTVIVKKPLNNQTYHFVADAVTGEPIARANVEFFGYWQERMDKKLSLRRYTIHTTNFAEFTDADGQVIMDLDKQSRNYQWIVIATTREGRFAYLGFSRLWHGGYHDREYNQTKTFLITDRPVYRPLQPVKFKFWVRHAKYDREDTSSFANSRFTVRINDPKGDKVFEASFKADTYGGFDGEFPLPKDATLGVYSIHIPGKGGGSFRVEEYKKPEFEVTIDAPDKPVMLGERIESKISAKYYFGAPVTKAKVTYKVLRYDHDGRWYPTGDWDWFYGPGYWWFAYDYEWYPGWSRWGCLRPHWWWWPARRTPPEVVMENEVEIGTDGTVTVEIDTGPAKELHGDTDHRYEITAEVVDLSRRTIVGKGSILVARKPFKVYAWVDRGHYRVGDVIRADFSAQTLDNKPVKGTGKLDLYRVRYKNAKPVETSVRRWKLHTDEQGRADVQISATRAGQYRLSYRVTDDAGRTIEGGYVFCIRGEGFDGRQFRFNQIELITDKREYAPGENVDLVVNTDRSRSTVVLFLRPSNGIYLKPKVIRLKGKSISEAIAITRKDMPNFFVEAFTISDGKIYSETREVIVPPEKRVLNVEVLPSSESYKPGEKARVKVKVTDSGGEPFLGSTVMTIYDKAVEYISGGSNVPEIRAFFWKWRRQHRPRTESNLSRWFRNLTDPGKRPMHDLGVFGRAVADEVGREGGFAMAPGSSRRREMFKYSSVRGARLEGLSLRENKEEMDASGAPAAEAAPPEEAVPTIRKKFADTAFWIGSLMTDETGTAEITLSMPENLTGWKIKTWAMGHGTKVGEGSAEVVTTKDLLLRLQAPRFFVEKDEVVLSANIHNYLEKDKRVRAVLELDGECLSPMDKLSKTVTVEANGEERVNWRVKVVKEGEAVVRMKALTDEESDAMEMKFPVYVHGMLKTDSFSGVIRPEDTRAAITINVPRERRIAQSRLEIRYSPTLAGAMVDALPYMASYPYGCTEQTLNRFLPTVITRKVLLEMGLDLEDIRKKRANLNAQEIGDDVERAKQWKRFKEDPVFDEAEVLRMVKEGVKRLTAMQLSDGGWGWFSGWGEHSYPHTTAYVVHGLQIAQENDAAIVPGVLERGVGWLKRYQAAELRKIKNWPKKKRPYKRYADNIDAFVYMVLADADIQDAEMREFLYRDRTHLAVYAKAMYGMALHKQGHEEKVAMIVRNIDQYLVEDDENQTAYLELPNGSYWWCWYGSEYEAHAYYLKLLVRTEPKGEKAPGIVKYLLNNRKHATYWKSTRDTSVVIEAFADYLRATDELKPDMTVEVLVGGRKVKEVTINTGNLFTFDNKVVLVGDAIESGKHKVELRKKGRGPLYFNAYLTNFTLEDFITRAGLEIKVNRTYYKLVKVDKKVKVAGSRGQALDQKVEKYERHELENLDLLTSGDLVEIELVIESKNDYEYLVFEDMKAAGFEPVMVRSGYGGNDMGAYMELRDERVCFFVRRLARGKHSVSYRMRAEIPGKFSALPTRGYAMYAPELKANSDEVKLRIRD